MAKRGQNEGSIYKRPDGRWTSVINLGYQNGKLKRQYFYGKTREAVAAKLTDALQKHREGLPVAFDRQTISQFLDRWLEDCAKPGVRQKTYEVYAQLVRLYLKPELGHVQLEKLTPQHVQEFMNASLKTGLSARTVQHARAVLRRALGHAQRWGLVSRNVATLVDPPRYRPPVIEPFAQDEIQTLLRAIEGHRFEALFYMALALGLRQGEVLGLRWKDIDVQARTLTVKGALQRIDGKLQLVEPKTERSRRTLPLHDNAIAMLRSHRVRQLRDQMLAGSSWKDSGLLFTSNVGTPLIARNVVRTFHKLLKDAGLPHHRFYDLRHSCASLLLAQGVPARTIMEILGHSQIGLTLNTYSHVSSGMLRDAAETMGAVLAAKN